MIFLNGFVHCDPHPGNVLVNKVKGNKSNDFEVVLLDHGLYQVIYPKLKDCLAINCSIYFIFYRFCPNRFVITMPKYGWPF